MPAGFEGILHVEPLSWRIKVGETGLSEFNHNAKSAPDFFEGVAVNYFRQLEKRRFREA